MSAIRVTIARARGSVPRAAGTSMLVDVHGIRGTIGGGALEWSAMTEARAMLAEGRRSAERLVPLGPALGQCCGGAVTLRFERAEDTTELARPLWIWGAGHVGRALVSVLGPFEDLAITWIDDAEDRFPDVPENVMRLVAAEMPVAARHAPAEAEHLIVTYSHEIDLALCHALLSRTTGQIGLIGSATKWARFRARLGALGHGPSAIARIRCPIGDPSLGKHPQAIAVGVAARMLRAPAMAERDAG
ncbi:xanthine dehydrogenase accessory protein XdhC [Palleronia sp. LCG004]|uniref:xanthine dehydrogenase accessory protein XdhC n=1 Tax=Palleronia sp. LCG004 TaxID=3079304 RepID=UPI002942744E|nr:xanthine dehydrogenase accessory protein XdhC [Palleronia sp. LCG004]WOI55515.1 xanthine dehydrogenase accessory protein XdhC [Palleronia sp. LCG004]